MDNPRDVDVQITIPIARFLDPLILIEKALKEGITINIDRSEKRAKKMPANYRCLGHYAKFYVYLEFSSCVFIGIGIYNV